MIKRTVEVSSQDIELNIRDSQVIVSRYGAVLDRIPAEDVGILIVDTPRAYYSHSTVLELMRYGAVIVLCGQNHHPATMMLPIEGNAVQTERIRCQIEANEPLKKRIWRRIVRHKISLQRANLVWMLDAGQKLKRNTDYDADINAAVERLKALEREVKSGDTSNCEGQAARIYWSSFFGSSFRRNRDGPEPNNLLNYGYMIMRAAVARALVSSGLHPSIGVFHRNRYDTYCLADDFVEVLRPLVDRHVWLMASEGSMEIDKETKQELLRLLTYQIESKAGKGPLLVALERMTSSLNKSLSSGRERLELPMPCW